MAIEKKVNVDVNMSAVFSFPSMCFIFKSFLDFIDISKLTPEDNVEGLSSSYVCSILIVFYVEQIIRLYLSTAYRQQSHFYHLPGGRPPNIRFEKNQLDERKNAFKNISHLHVSIEGQI